MSRLKWIAQKINNEKSRFVLQIIQFMMDAYADFGYNPPICILHDPLAAGVAVHTDLIEAKKFHVEVETSGKLTRGMTVIDQRIGTENSSMADVAVEVEAQRFTAEFMESLLWWTQNGTE